MESINHCRRNAMRRLSMATIGLVAGCSRIPLAHQTYQASTAKLPSPENYPVTAEKLAAAPYASLGAQFQGQPKIVMTLATVENEQLNWVSSNYITLATRQELLVSTKGLPIDLNSVRSNKPSPVTALLPGEQTASIVFRSQLYKSPHGKEQWVDITSRYQNLGERQISMLGTIRTVWLVEEHADYKSWRWEAVNQYWIDPGSRFTWRSRQQFTPEIDPLTLEMLKPYG